RIWYRLAIFRQTRECGYYKSFFDTTSEVSVREVVMARQPGSMKNILSDKVSPLYADEEVRIACEDNLKFMHNLTDNSVKLIVTSPPYNMGKAYETRSSLEKYRESQAATIAEAVRVLHPQGSICWQVGNFVVKGEVIPLDILLYPLFTNHS